MSNESIQGVSVSPQFDAGNVGFLEKAFSPYKSTLKQNVRNKDPFLSQLAGISVELCQLAMSNPGMLKALKDHPGLLFLLRTNPKFLNVALQNPTFLDELMHEPQKFLEKKREVVQDKNESQVAKNNLDKIAKSKSRRLESLKNVDKFIKSSQINVSQKNKVDMKVNTSPHQLESEIVAKAHIENPNTGTPVGDFRQVVKTNSSLPHDLELSPELVTNARAFSLSPELLALMSAQAIVSSRTKRLSVTGDPDDDDYSIDSESEKGLFVDPDELHEVEKIDEVETPRKV